MRFLQSAVLVLSIVISAGVFAQKAVRQNVLPATPGHIDSTQMSAHEMVQATTKRVMDIIVEAREYFEKDPKRFFTAVETILEDVVDFDSFARGVMGKYASSSHYQQLDAEEQARLRAQVKRFSTVFKDGLVQTYATGLLAFNGNRIDVLAADERATDDDNGMVTVVQHIYGNAEKPYVVQYKVRRNKAGEWKLRNVTIEAINLGKVYRSQFYSAVKQYNGDIDKVIDNWSVDPTQSQATES